MSKKEYKADGLTVGWEPGKCQHSGVCVKTLPQVYKPKESPWINAEGATKDDLMSQINACPSGALSYKLDEE